jgi:hypothetical protein
MSFELSNQELDSALWQKITGHLESRLEVARKRNDGDLSEFDTARLRGRIEAYKELLGFNDPAITITDREASEN